MRRLLQLFQSNWVSAVGSTFTTLAFLGVATFYVVQSVGPGAGPYQGLILVGLLGVFALGLVLVPLGLLLYRHTLRDRVASSRLKASQILVWLGALTLVNFAVFGLAGSRGVSHMSSVQFCGTACHQVMQPEYDTYFDSPHADVSCVECHVGPGATWYLKAKLNGARQAWMAVAGTWTAPIPTPVQGMRPASETCGHCHSSGRYVPERLRVRHHFDEDAVRYTDVLMMKIGGERPDGTAEGIHWHAHPGTEVTYVHTDEDRMEIPWVQVRRADGSVRVFTAEGVEGTEPPEGTLRTMDCTDCHNRPTHRFHGLDEALDRALLFGRLDRELPGIVPASKTVLEEEHTRDGASRSVREGLTRFYAEGGFDPAPSEQALDAASDALAAIWLRNVYPERGVDWGTYPSLDNHAGCLRCHDGEHADAAGEVISIDCDSCHTVLGMQEEDPEILELLGTDGTW